MPGPVRRFTRRLQHAAFEALIGGLAIVNATASLAQSGAVTANAYDQVLPHWTATLFQLGYLLAGLLLIAGLGIGRADVEAAGLIIIATSQVSRGIVNVALLGWSIAAVSLAFAVLVVAVCWTRLHQLITAQATPKDGP
jgi:hypothetical protein